MYNPLKSLLKPDEDVWNIHSSTYGSHDNFIKQAESYNSEKYDSLKDSSVYSKSNEMYARNAERDEDKRNEEDELSKRIDEELSKKVEKEDAQDSVPKALAQQISTNALLIKSETPAKKKQESIKNMDKHSTKSIEEAIEDAVHRSAEENKIIILE